MYKAYYIPRSDNDYEFATMVSSAGEIDDELAHKLQRAIEGVLIEFYYIEEIKILSFDDPEAITILEEKDEIDQ